MTVEFIKSYLKIDDDDLDAESIEKLDKYIEYLIEISDIYITSMVSAGYKADAKAVKLAELLQQKLIADMYSNRGTEIPSNTKTDRIVISILDKLSGFEVVTYG